MAHRAGIGGHGAGFARVGVLAGALVLGMALGGCGASDGTGSDGGGEVETSDDSARGGWQQAETLDEALRGSGIASFELPDSVKVGGMSFDGASSFMYANGMVSARYETDDACVTALKWNDEAGGVELLMSPTDVSGLGGTVVGGEVETDPVESATEGRLPSDAEQAPVDAAADASEDVLALDGSSDAPVLLQWDLQAGGVTYACYGTSPGAATSVEWSAGGFCYRLSCDGIDTSLLAVEGDVAEEEGDGGSAAEAPVEEEGTVVAGDADAVDGEETSRYAEYADVAYLAMTDEEVLAIVPGIK